jgi:hypothetical protein
VPDARKPPQVPIPQEDELRREIKLEIKAENNGSDSSMSDVPDYKPSESEDTEDTAVEDNNA